MSGISDEWYRLFDRMMNNSAELPPEIAGAISERLRVRPDEASRQIELLQARNRVLEARSNAEPIYDGGLDHLAALAGERDRALSRASHAMENWTTAVRERNEARQNSDEWYHRWLRLESQCETRVAEIAILRAELMAARDTIAKLTPQTVPDTPSAAPNPFREFGGGRRRIGG